MQQIIKKYRKAHGLSQRELEELAGLPKKYVYFYEKGVRDIPTPYLTRIADVLSIPMDELFEKKEQRIDEELAEELKVAALRVLKNYRLERIQ